MGSGGWFSEAILKEGHPVWIRGGVELINWFAVLLLIFLWIKNCFNPFIDIILFIFYCLTILLYSLKRRFKYFYGFIF